MDIKAIVDMTLIAPMREQASMQRTIDGKQDEIKRLNRLVDDYRRKDADHERMVGELRKLLKAEDLDGARDIVDAEYGAIHGPAHPQEVLRMSIHTTKRGPGRKHGEGHCKGKHPVANFGGNWKGTEYLSYREHDLLTQLTRLGPNSTTREMGVHGPLTQKQAMEIIVAKRK